MPYKVVAQGRQWLVVDTQTHQIRGRHAARGKANTQRRILETIRRRKGKK